MLKSYPNPPADEHVGRTNKLVYGYILYMFFIQYEKLHKSCCTILNCD